MIISAALINTVLVGALVNNGCEPIWKETNSKTVTPFWIAKLIVLIISPADLPPHTSPPSIDPSIGDANNFTVKEFVSSNVGCVSISVNSAET